ncbi:hypothetical protein Lser_V15G20875 [Lactuca serriola]
MVPETPLAHKILGRSSPVRDSPVNLNFEETGNHDITVKTSTMDTTINHGEQPKISTPEQITVIPLEVLNTVSFREEVRSSSIIANISDMGANVNKGDGVSKHEAQGNPSLVVSSTFKTSNIDTLISLPPFIVPNTSHIPSSTHSPTFDTIMQQPITSLFASQSTKEPITVHDDETDDAGFVGSFADIEFDPEEENIPNNMLMSGKHFKILNRKLNSLLQLQADAGGKHSVSGIEVDVMLKPKSFVFSTRLISLRKTMN